MVSTALLGAEPSPSDRLRALIVWFGCVESAGAPPRAHIKPEKPEAVLVGISASPAKRCTDFVHATTIPAHYNTNFTAFEAAACNLAITASARPHGAAMPPCNGAAAKLGLCCTQKLNLKLCRRCSPLSRPRQVRRKSISRTFPAHPCSHRRPMAALSSM